ncbi:MAG: hotdog fold thioesterase [Pseudomonadota bacterium]
MKGEVPVVEKMKISREQIIAFMEHEVRFNRMLGIHLVSLENGLAIMELPFQEDLVGDPFRPALHGGVISTLVDTCGGAAVWSACEPEDRVSTVDLRVDFLRPGPLETLRCEATVQRMGNRVGVTDMKVMAVSSPADLIATGRGVYNVRRAE